MGLPPTERLILRRQIAAAAGKKSTTSLSMFMETYGLEVEDELPPWPLSSGQMEPVRENGITNKKKLG